MATHEQDDKNTEEIDAFSEKLEKARQASSKRAERADDLTTRFRELRRRNHFRLMLEEIFHE